MRLEGGKIVKPVTKKETDCFHILTDLDHIGGKVSGSMTSKKHMRVEIWSLTFYLGIPAWYVTIAPADSKNPICLYFMSGEKWSEVKLRCHNEHLLLIANNAVPSARFFHFIVQLFIKHILGIGTNHPGIFGETSGYYETVEQEGHLTLHLHILIWITGCPVSDEIRKWLLDPMTKFQSLLIEYLENVHVSKFLTSSKEEVEKHSKNSAK